MKNKYYLTTGFSVSLIVSATTFAAGWENINSTEVNAALGSAIQNIKHKNQLVNDSF